jgi:hypothetical protein
MTSKPFTYFIRERLPDGTFWKQGEPHPDDVPRTFGRAADRDHEARCSVIGGMCGVSRNGARWAVDEEGRLLVGLINTRDPRLSVQFTPGKVQDYLARGYLDVDPFTEPE